MSETRRDARQRREAGRVEGDSQGCSLEPLSFPYFFGGAKKYGWVWASSPKGEQKSQVWACSPKDEEKSRVWASSPRKPKPYLTGCAPAFLKKLSELTNR